MGGSKLDLETELYREIEHTTTGSIQISRQVFDAPVVTMNFGSDLGMLYTRLTPTEAREVGSALIEAADEVEADHELTDTQEDEEVPRPNA